MRRIKDDTNASEIIPVIRLLGLRLRLRWIFGSSDMQWLEGLIAPDRKLELDK